MGCSVAYHLAHAGWADVLLLEQGRLSGGTTWHAAGLVGTMRASETGTRLVQYSAELYARLEAETGLATGYRQVGGVVVARTPDRMTALRRTAASAEAPTTCRARSSHPGRRGSGGPCCAPTTSSAASGSPVTGRSTPATSPSRSRGVPGPAACASARACACQRSM